MHDGGEVRLAALGGAGVQASISVAGVKKDAAGTCQAEISTLASASAIGVPNQTRSDYRLNVKKDRAGVQRHDAAGHVAAQAGNASAEGSIGAQGLESLAYAGLITSEGQRLPAENYTLSLDMQSTFSGMPQSAMKVPSAKVTSSEKVVGKLSQLETRLGVLSCWPVRFERTTHMGAVVVAGHTMAPPAVTAQVTDWYCPDYALVMKQETVQNGRTGVVEVVSVK
jgi:hypothetical protein